MTIKKGMIDKRHLKPVTFIFTNKGKKVLGNGVRGPIETYYDMLTSVTKKNLFQIEKNFKNILNIDFKWKEVHGIQFEQGGSRYSKQNARLVWSIVYTGETEFGDKVHYYRYEAPTPGAGMSWLYANGCSTDVYVSTFVGLDINGVNTDCEEKVLEWLCQTGISKNINHCKLTPKIRLLEEKLAALEKFKETVGRKKIKPDYSSLEAVLFLIAKTCPQSGGNTFSVGKASEEFLMSSIKIEKPIETFKDWDEKYYVLKDGGIVRLSGLGIETDDIYVILIDHIKNHLPRMKAKTILKIAEYYKKQLEM